MGIKRVFNVDLSREIYADIQMSDFLDRLSGQVAGAFQSHPFDETSMTLLFEPGYPWPSDDDDSKGFSYWSAKSQKMISPERPSWLLPKPRDTTNYLPKVNPCLVFPAKTSDIQWPVWCRSKERKGCGDLLVCHATTFKPETVKDTARIVRQCGGLLFPSISVGCTPASNFGPITFVGNLGLVLDGLKPNKSKYPACWVYDTDAWTSQTKEFVGEVAHRLFEELHGHENFAWGMHIWALGTPGYISGGPGGESIPLESVKQLTKAVKLRGAVFPSGMTATEFKDTSERVSGTVDAYSYCEAKGRRVLSLDEFPALIAPSSYHDVVKVFVRESGYTGRVVFLPDTLNLAAAEEYSDEWKYKLYQWSWIVAGAIKAMFEPMDVI